MSLSSRFAVALHALAVLTELRDQEVTSGLIASSINTNPVVARRILASLKAAGLVQTREGADGGYRLTRCPHEITLDSVYRAVEPEPLFNTHVSPPNPDCPIGAAIAPVLQTLLSEAESALHQSLAATTLAAFSARLGFPTPVDA